MKCICRLYLRILRKAKNLEEEWLIICELGVQRTDTNTCFSVFCISPQRRSSLDSCMQISVCGGTFFSLVSWDRQPDFLEFLTHKADYSFPTWYCFIWNHHEFWALGTGFDSFGLTVNSREVPYYNLKEMYCSRQHCLCPGHIAVLYRRLQCQVISIGTCWVYKVLRNEGALTYSLAVCTLFLLVLTRVRKCPFCLKLRKRLQWSS